MDVQLTYWETMESYLERVEWCLENCKDKWATAYPGWHVSLRHNVEWSQMYNAPESVFEEFKTALTWYGKDKKRFIFYLSENDAIHFRLVFG